MEADLQLGQIVILGGHFKGEALHHGLLNLAYIAQGILLHSRNGLLVLCFDHPITLLESVF